MTIWQEAEETLHAIRADLNEDPPRWESAAKATDDLKLRVPESPKFEDFDVDVALQPTDWGITEVDAALTYLQLGIKTQNLKLALENTALALDRVQSLRRREPKG
jgi:hypothetical protein